MKKIFFENDNNTPLRYSNLLFKEKKFIKIYRQTVELRHHTDKTLFQDGFVKKQTYAKMTRKKNYFFRMIKKSFLDDHKTKKLKKKFENPSRNGRDT